MVALPHTYAAHVRTCIHHIPAKNVFDEHSCGRSWQDKNKTHNIPYAQRHESWEKQSCHRWWHSHPCAYNCLRSTLATVASPACGVCVCVRVRKRERVSNERKDTHTDENNRVCEREEKWEHARVCVCQRERSRHACARESTGAKNQALERNWKKERKKKKRARADGGGREGGREGGRKGGATRKSNRKLERDRESVREREEERKRKIERGKERKRGRESER